jgi:4-alpha-glucanotransferase
MISEDRAPAPTSDRPFHLRFLPGETHEAEPVRVGRAICGDIGQAERREWWVANGLGAYAGGTVAGSLTRRYHGLLIAPLDPPLGRRLILAKADATLVVDDTSYQLFTNRWTRNQIDPPGYLLTESFRLELSIPVWTYEVAGLRVEQRIWMEPGGNTTYLSWCLLDPHPNVALKITLLANNRDHHGETQPQTFSPSILAADGRLELQDQDRFSLTIVSTGGTITADLAWYTNFELPVEAERGLSSTDAHLCIGHAIIPLETGEHRGLAASLHELEEANLRPALLRRTQHDSALLNAAPPTMGDAPSWIQRLVIAADSFVFARPLPDLPDGRSIIAGYPWFGDWGRDTMISLPGLALATGKPELAAQVLTTFSRFVSQGMLPNVFPDGGADPQYNTADASLWYFEAWRAYVESTSDSEALKEVYPILCDMIAWHVKGTRFGIGVDPSDGLLRAGVEGVQLTWMDAKVGDKVITPRIGKPVEINALWYNALHIMSEFAHSLGEPDIYRASADRMEDSFGRFVRKDGIGLYDVIDGPAGDDASIRPNQIFAVSLPHSPLDPSIQRDVVRICRQHLVTSYGLRSLAPGSPDYHASYGGDVAARDGGYHQGPVWGWLLGPFALAHYRVTGDAESALALLEPMRDALADMAIGSIGEIFDGDPPHHPRGAPSQAWSVACTLDAWRRIHAHINTEG